MELRDLNLKFENFVADLFRHNGFQVDQNNLSESGQRRLGVQPDMIVDSGQMSAVVEVKVWRSSKVSMSFLLQGLDTLERYKRNLSIKTGILVISAIIKKDQKETLQKNYPTTVIYDLNTLSFLASDSEALSSKFEEFTREILVFSPAFEIAPEAPRINNEETDAAPVPIIADELPKDGERLVNELRLTPSGKIGWRKFEKSCADALKYIFQNDLTGWSEQRRTESGISVYDTVCRIVSNHDLWRMFIEQFNSRYVIFEYKNYRHKIKQGQVYTTEKYLYKPALRSVAFLISRIGPDENASAACRGALREHGKLIVNLTLEDVCQMLQAKDLEDDPNALLMAKIDDMLTALDR